MDPFAHHPELRGLIGDPLKSSFRDFRPESLDEHLKALGAEKDPRLSDEERNAGRLALLAGRAGEDLWVFAYGSLMWDPAFRFAEVRRAHVAGYARRFILVDKIGGRGTKERPGLMAALDTADGSGCDGLAFRISADLVEQETEILWRRERVMAAYHEVRVRAELSDRTVDAITFVADHAADDVEPGLAREAQVRYLATGAGFLGTSLDYIRNVAGHFAALGVEDPDVAALLADAEAYGRSNGTG